MREELRARIMAYNKSVAENTEMASDMNIIVSELNKLPSLQLRKVLTEEALAVLRKYNSFGQV